MSESTLLNDTTGDGALRIPLWIRSAPHSVCSGLVSGMSILPVTSTGHVIHLSAEIDLASDLLGLEGYDFG